VILRSMFDQQSVRSVTESKTRFCPTVCRGIKASEILLSQHYVAFHAACVMSSSALKYACAHARVFNAFRPIAFCLHESVLSNTGKRLIGDK